MNGHKLLRNRIQLMTKNENSDDAYDHVELREYEGMQEDETSDDDIETVIYDMSEFIYMLAIADCK